jgi:hypothetical protein
VVEWADRRLPTDALRAPGAGGRPLAVGAPWETVLQLSHGAGDVPVWVNVPVYASADYVAALAGLLAAGAPGPAGLSCSYVYVEHGNELWLSMACLDGSANYVYNRAAAVAEVAAGGSPLNADGETDPEAWARRRHAKRLYADRGRVPGRVPGQAARRAPRVCVDAGRLWATPRRRWRGWTPPTARGRRGARSTG